jgi:hypothetical protein
VGDKENPSDNEHAATHYMSVGYSAMRSNGGRTHRQHARASKVHLDSRAVPTCAKAFAAMFPNAKIGACDLYRYHLDFCVEHFDAEPISTTYS